MSDAGYSVEVAVVGYFPRGLVEQIVSDSVRNLRDNYPDPSSRTEIKRNGNLETAFRIRSVEQHPSECVLV